ncbi:MAG: D-inositol-3-phosphate glycosyltransferase [Fimbriimonadaceae bacterium]|nr:D-inositol-3-phosphate glycosyltransferase [Fimbriimonadaceae bacterium]
MARKDPVRVWFLMSDLDDCGGAPRVNHDILVNLDRERFDLTQVYFYHAGDIGEQIRASGVRTVEHMAHSPVDALPLFRLWNLAMDLRPQVIFTTENALALTYAGILKQFGIVKAVVTAMHTARPLSKQGEIAWKLSLRHVDQIVALSQRNKDYWQHKSGLPDERFRIIVNGIDTAKFDLEPDKRGLRQRIGLPDDRTIIGTIANFNTVKNLGLFVDVAHDLIESGLNVHFAMVGDGVDKPMVESKIASYGHQDRFLLPGKVWDPETWQRAIDIGCLTSHSEALPLTVLEAQACGSPVVSTDVGGVRDVIVQGETGFYVPAGDRTSLVEKLRYLIENPEKRAEMGVKGRNRVLGEFSVDQMVRRYEDCFLEVVGASR